MNDHPSPYKGNILIVDDMPDNLRLLSRMLINHGYKVRGVTNSKMALTAIQTIPPDLILLDIRMPEMDGYQVCECLKANEKTREIPVIFLSALDEVIDKVKAFHVGGVDYITKPFQFEEILVRIENQLALRFAQLQIYQLNEQLEERVQERTGQLQAEILEHKQTQQQLQAEINERRLAQERLIYLASHDALTELPNRGLFMEKLTQAIHKSQQEPDYLFAVLFLDCDHFKMVNDSLGHLTGDQLLIQIAHRLQSCLSNQDMMARFGGDEFTILLGNIDHIEQVTEIAKRLLNAFGQPFYLENREMFTNVSLGIVLGQAHYQKPEEILRDADIAMYRAKGKGRGCYQIFTQQMHTEIQKRVQLETDLRLALQREQFILYYQPIVSLLTGRITGFEALLRWHHPQKGLVAPDQFIPLAEETGLIIPIGLWALREACSQLQTWLGEKLTKFPLKINVNLSVKQFCQSNLIEKIDQILQEYQLNGEHLGLEITESAIMDNAQSALSILEQLRCRDIQLSIDDFGTGYSSLSYLHQFPVDTLKIDRSFIQCIRETQESVEIVEAILTLAHTLNMSVTAEGVETPQQLKLLKQMGCEEGQGYFFSRPVRQEIAGSLMSEQWRF